MSGYTLVDEGRYKARAVSEPVLGLTGTGKAQIAIMVEITDESPFKGTRRPFYGFLSEAAYERTIESLEYMGWFGDDISALKLVDLPNEFEIEIEHEAYEGETHDKIKWVNALGRGPMVKNVMGEIEAKKFAVEMRAKILMSRQSRGVTPPNGKPSSAPRTQPPRPQPPRERGPESYGLPARPGIDDDIPF